MDPSSMNTPEGGASDALPAPRTRAELLHELGRLGAEVPHLRDEQQVFETVDRRLFACGYRSAIFIVEEGEFVIRHLSATPIQLQEFEKRLGRRLVGMVMGSPSPAAQRVLSTGLPQYARSIEGQGLAATSVGSEVAERNAKLPAVYAPWAHQGRVAGMIMVYGEDVGPDLVDVFGLFGSLLGSALESCRLIADLERRNRDLGLLAEVSEAVTKSLDLKTTLDTAIRTLTQIVDASNAFVMLVDDDGQRLLCAAATPPYDQRLGDIAVDLGEASVTATCFREGRAVAVEDTTSGDGFKKHLVDRFGEKALLALPLRTHKGMVGAMLLDDTRRPRRFSAQELDRATAVANHIAAAIENARLYEEVQRRVSDLTRVAEVSEAVAGSLDLELVLDTAVRRLQEICDVPRVTIWLADAGRKYLTGAMATPPFQAETRATKLPLDQLSLAARCFNEARLIAIEDVSAGSGYSPELSARYRPKSLLGLPLRSRGGVLGVVVFNESRRPRHFTAQEIERASAIANHVAVAIENARLYEEQKLSYDKLAAAQAELVRRERLAALGELSAVVAHEVRNPLGVIFNSIGTLKRLARLEGDAARLLDIVDEEADHLNRLVGDLLEFARPHEPTLTPTDVGEMIDEVIASTSHENTSSVVFERDVSPQLPLVPMDRHLMRRALINVAVNAVQAMPKGGRVTFRVRKDGSPSQPWARIDVIDDGPGVPPHVARRVFEPFFTTKATGTGLGLAVVKRIVEEHRGEVSIESAVGSGATVTFRLPFGASAVS